MCYAMLCYVLCYVLCDAMLCDMYYRDWETKTKVGLTGSPRKKRKKQKTKQKKESRENKNDKPRCSLYFLFFI